jgi:hypothetical protein
MSYIVANHEKLCVGNYEFGLTKYLYSYFEAIFTCGKILRHEADGFTSLLKKGVLQIFIVLKNPSPRPDLKSRPLGPIASMLTTTPPKLFPIFILSVQFIHFVYRTFTD